MLEVSVRGKQFLLPLAFLQQWKLRLGGSKPGSKEEACFQHPQWGIEEEFGESSFIASSI